jgi:hypothetical protein
MGLDSERKTTECPCCGLPRGRSNASYTCDTCGAPICERCADFTYNVPADMFAFYDTRVGSMDGSDRHVNCVACAKSFWGELRRLKASFEAWMDRRMKRIRPPVDARTRIDLLVGDTIELFADFLMEKDLQQCNTRHLAAHNSMKELEGAIQEFATETMRNRRLEKLKVDLMRVKNRAKSRKEDGA